MARLAHPEQGVSQIARRLPNIRGKTRIAWTWKEMLERRRGPLIGDWKVQLADGREYVLPAGSYMTWTLAWTGEWDDHVRDHLLGQIRPGGLMLDVGASLGLWTVPLGLHAGASGSRVWAFEPYPPNLSYLRGNIDRNGLGEVVTVQPIALGSQATEVCMAFAEVGGGNAAIVYDADTPGQVVSVVTLDDLELPCPVSFMKLDCEGYEIEVLEGARRTIERDRPLVFGEFSRGWLTSRKQSPRKHLDWFVSLGYTVHALQSHRRSRWASDCVVRSVQLSPPFDDVPDDLLLVPGR